MTLMHGKIYCLGVVFLTALSACSPTKVPQTDFDAATQALETARAGQAATYAPMEVNFAEERLSQAQAAMGQREYAMAQRMAEQSLVNSELALAKANVAKAREQVAARVKDNQAMRDELLDGGPGQ